MLYRDAFQIALRLKDLWSAFVVDSVQLNGDFLFNWGF